MFSLETEFIADLTNKCLLDMYIYTLTHCMTVLQSWTLKIGNWAWP